MSDYTEFFLASRREVVQLELIEISHSSFSQIYRKVRNNSYGVTIPAIGEFDYYPMRLTPIASRENLDFGLKVDLGDLGEILPTELDRVMTDATFSEKPSFRYWTYRSDDLTAPLFGPLLLEITTFSFTREGASFEAKAPSLNINGTGEIYTFERFPMLRGFL